jgi:ribosomal protein L23
MANFRSFLANDLLIPGFICNFADNMKPTIIEDEIFEFEPFEKDGSELMAAETSWRGMAEELQELHYLKGASFIKQLKLIVYYGEFRLVEGETDIYSAISEQSDDFDNLINAARKAVAHGNKVYILPNPKGIRTADYIFENKGIFKMYDLKTISGKASLENRLIESIGQTNHVLINVCTKYNPRLMATQIRSYFQVNPKAIEVLVYKGKKAIVVTRRIAENRLFLIQFHRKFVK